MLSKSRIGHESCFISVSFYLYSIRFYDRRSYHHSFSVMEVIGINKKQYAKIFLDGEYLKASERTIRRIGDEIRGCL